MYLVRDTQWNPIFLVAIFTIRMKKHSETVGQFSSVGLKRIWTERLIHIIFFFSIKPREIYSSWFIISGLNFLSWWAFQTFSCCSYTCYVNIIFISFFVKRNFPWKPTKVAWNVIILFPWKFWWVWVSTIPLFTDLICTSLYNKGIVHEWEWALQCLGPRRFSSVKHKRTKVTVIGNYAIRKDYEILVNVYGYSRWSFLPIWKSLVEREGRGE